MGRKKNNSSPVVELEKSLKKSSRKQKEARKENKGVAVTYTPGTVVNAGLDAQDRTAKFSKWSTSDGSNFVPAGAVSDELPPGLYEINVNDQIGIYFTRMNISLEGILRLPDSRTDEIVKDISTFWERESIFKKYDLAFRRGALLYGAPGTSKSCTIKLIVSDVIKRGGIALNFGEPVLFGKGLRILRDISVDVPIVAILEDIDALIEQYSESDLINLIDGVTRVNKIVFLASTNYPERLGERLTNRPSRFDRRYKFECPTADARRVYFEHLFSKDDALKYDLDEWVEDTENLSLAHLKELFTSVVILGNSYESSIEVLKAMAEAASSGSDSEGSVGFNTEN